MKNRTYPHGRVKGAAIRDFVAWYEHTYGSGRLQQAILALPAEGQAEFNLERECVGVLPSAWFPAWVVHAILDHLTEGMTVQAHDDLAQQAGEAAVKAMMHGVQRVVFATLLTPRTFAKVANLAFRLNYDEGRVVNEELDGNRHRGYVEGWTAHHPFLCEMNIAIKAGIYEAMKCENVRVEERFCRSRGDETCGSIIAWG